MIRPAEAERGFTAIMLCSRRARPSSPPAAPATWKEIETIDAPRDFTVGAARELARCAAKVPSGRKWPRHKFPDL